MAEEKVRCSLWGWKWSQAMPTFIVEDAIKKGILKKECIHPSVKPYIKE